MLEVVDLTKSYDKVEALRGVSLHIGAGEVCALLGPNGAGKTTLVSIVAGLLRPDGGEVRVGGFDAVGESRKARRLIGLAPQELAVYPTVTVRENLVFFGELAGLRRAELDARVDEVAAALGLDEVMDRIARRMSGGEKRRLHTAMALLHRPPLLLLDEPTTGVDVHTRSELLDAVRRLAAEGSAVCYSTHYLPEVEALDASVTIIDDGEVVASGTLASLVAQHGTSSLELRFLDGHVPEIDLGLHVVREDGVLRVHTDAPGADLPAVIARLGAAAERLDTVEMLRPNLETAFLSVTGRRYEAAPGADA
jgi:ABC-2 type transport system ATP-binding protein